MKSAVLKYVFKPSIPLISITGIIDPKMTQSVLFQLSKISTTNISALGVLVNSPGGLPAQCSVIVQALKQFSHQYHLPLYTFGQDVAASGGYFILAAGDKVYADSGCLVGSIGVVSQQLKLKKLLDQKKIEYRKIASSDNLFLNQFDSFSDLDNKFKEKWEESLRDCHQKFIQEIEHNREGKLKVKKEERMSKIYNGDVFVAETALQLGLIDETGNYLHILNKLHPKNDIFHLKPKSRKEWLSNMLSAKFEVFYNDL